MQPTFDVWELTHQARQETNAVVCVARQESALQGRDLHWFDLALWRNPALQRKQLRLWKLCQLPMSTERQPKFSSQKLGCALSVGALYLGGYCVFRFNVIWDCNGSVMRSFSGRIQKPIPVSGEVVCCWGWEKFMRGAQQGNKFRLLCMDCCTFLQVRSFHSSHSWFTQTTRRKAWRTIMTRAQMETSFVISVFTLEEKKWDTYATYFSHHVRRHASCVNRGSGLLSNKVKVSGCRQGLLKWNQRTVQGENTWKAQSWDHMVPTLWSYCVLVVLSGPIHTGREAQMPANGTCVLRMGVHTGCKQHQRICPRPVWIGP